MTKIRSNAFMVILTALSIIYFTKAGAQSVKTYTGTSSGDSFVVTDSYVQISGYEGNDTIQYSSCESYINEPLIISSPDYLNFSFVGKNINKNVFYGGEGADKLILSDNDDVLFLQPASPFSDEKVVNGIEIIEAGDGNDFVDFKHNELLYGSVTIYGGPGNDVLIGNTAPDSLLGGQGNDFLEGNTGINYYSGGSGDDTYIVDFAFGVPAETISENYISGETPYETNTIKLQNILPENLFCTICKHNSDFQLILAKNNSTSTIDSCSALFVALADSVNNIIQKIEFDDGTFWEKKQIDAAINKSAETLAENGFVKQLLEAVSCPCVLLTGVNDKNYNSHNIQVYPNPTNNILNIQNFGGRKMHLKLFTVNGMLVFEKQSASIITTIQLNELQNGIYLLNATDETNKQSQTFKIVKQ